MNKDQLEHWEEWHRRCTLQGCSQDTTDALSAYGRKSFLAAAMKLDCPKGMLELPDRNPDGSVSEGSASWYYVEDRLLNGHHASGKTYKAYIVDYAIEQTPGYQLNSLRRGFSDQTRNVVRAFYADVVNQYHRDQASDLFQLDMPIGENGETSGRDLDLPFLAASESIEELNDLEKTEFKEIADKLAPQVWERMEHREKIVILASLLGISLAAPEVEVACGCKKTQVYAAFKAFGQRVKAACADQGFEGDAYAIMALECFMTFALLDRLKSWTASEKSATPLLNKAGGLNHD